MKLKQSKYINLPDFMSKGYSTTFLLGARGVGKTIGAFKMAINRFLETGELTIYMRRYLTEIETSAIDLALLSKITGHKITRDTVELNGVSTDMILCDDKPCVYLLALSVAGKYKSNSYSNVWLIIYDEFLDLRGRELKNETNLFLNFAMTVFRDFTKYQALFLANNTNLFNCYFLDFEVLPTGNITKFRSKSIKLVVYRTSEELDNERNNTVLAKMVRIIEGEENSSLSNVALANYEDFIRPLSSKAHYLGTYLLNGEKYGCYKDGMNYVISRKADLKNKRKRALTIDDVTVDYPLVEWEQYGTIRGAFLSLHVFFTDVKTRSIFIRRFKNATLNGGQ